MRMGFSREAIFLFLMFLFITAGVMFCFWGYKYFRTILLMLLSSVICFLGYQLAEYMAENLIARLIICILLSFSGVCLAYFVYIIVIFLLDRVSVRRKLASGTYIVSALSGAAILALAAYKVWHNPAAAGLVFFLCAGSGLTVQHRKKDEQVQFKTYNDLLKLKPLEDKERQTFSRER